MTYTTLDKVKQPLDIFRGFDTDTQLALLWYGYVDIKDNLNPAPPDTVDSISNALFDNVKALSKEEQLEAQRQIVRQDSTDISRQYGALSNSAKLEFWLLLAQGMQAGTIIDVPQDYVLPEKTNEFIETVKDFSFEERVNFTRNAVAEMGYPQGHTS
ncbi:MAG: Orange carotenoid protein [Leptolyngbya sp. SIO4C1]|nr:Orange carotenoid protein [Leptolyngbya sp. SIO4C1]